MVNYNSIGLTTFDGEIIESIRDEYTAYHKYMSFSLRLEKMGYGWKGFSDTLKGMARDEWGHATRLNKMLMHMSLMRIPSPSSVLFDKPISSTPLEELVIDAMKDEVKDNRKYERMATESRHVKNAKIGFYSTLNSISSDEARHHGYLSELLGKIRKEKKIARYTEDDIWQRG